MSLLNYLGGVQSNYLKRILFNVLNEKYSNHEMIIERLGYTLQTEADTAQFVKLISELYEAGYAKAINDHKAQLEKLGLKVTMSQSKDG